MDIPLQKQNHSSIQYTTREKLFEWYHLFASILKYVYREKLFTCHVFSVDADRLRKIIKQDLLEGPGAEYMLSWPSGVTSRWKKKQKKLTCSIDIFKKNKNNNNSHHLLRTILIVFQFSVRRFNLNIGWFLRDSLTSRFTLTVPTRQAAAHQTRGVTSSN